MATTYNVGKAALDPVKLTPIYQPKYLASRDITVVSTYTPTAAVLNDVWNMLTVPAGATIVDVSLDCADLDTGAGIVLAVGDATTAGRFITGSTVAQAGGLVRMTVQGGLGYTYAAATTIAVKVTTAAATYQAGLVTLAVTYTMDS